MNWHHLFSSLYHSSSLPTFATGELTCEVDELTVSRT